MLGWVVRLFRGEPKKKRRRRAAPQVPAAPRAKAPAPTSTWAALSQPNRIYLARANMAMRRIVDTRQRWLAELDQAYAGIGRAPEPTVLGQLGNIGARYGTEFDSLARLVAAIDVPATMVEVHRALTAWVDALDRACDVLVDARMQQDRTLLRRFREQLGASRMHASALQTVLAVHGLLVRVDARRAAGAKKAA